MPGLASAQPLEPARAAFAAQQRGLADLGATYARNLAGITAKYDGMLAESLKGLGGLGGRPGSSAAQPLLTQQARAAQAIAHSTSTPPLAAALQPPPAAAPPPLQLPAMSHALRKGLDDSSAFLKELNLQLAASSSSSSSSAAAGGVARGSSAAAAVASSSDSVVVVDDDEEEEDEVVVVEDEDEVVVVEDEGEEEEERGAAAAAAARPQFPAAAAAAAAGASSASSAASAAECERLRAATHATVMRPLTPEELALLAAAMNPALDRAAVHGRVDNLKFTYEEAKDLQPGTWLRDDVINIFYMILRLRGEGAMAAALAAGAPDGIASGACWAHNSFFYAKLMGQVGPPVYNYPGVRNWTAKRGKRSPVDIFAYRYVVMPINRGNVHWAAAVIDNHQRTVTYLDSLRGSGSDVTGALLQYLADEHLDKRGAPLPQPYRVGAPPADLPLQTNGVDCGGFVCAFGELISRGVMPSSACFTQRDLGYWRRRIGVSCIRGGLLQ